MTVFSYKSNHRARLSTTSIFIQIEQPVLTPVGNHVHQQQYQPGDPVTRNGKSKSEMVPEAYPNTECHANSAYLDDEEDSFSEIHQGK